MKRLSGFYAFIFRIARSSSDSRNSAPHFGSEHLRMRILPASLMEIFPGSLNEKGAIVRRIVAETVARAQLGRSIVPCVNR